MILCFVEHEANQLSAGTLSAVTLARGLAAQMNTTLEAVAFGGSALAEALREYGVTQLHTVADERLAEYAPEAWAHSLAQLASALKPAALVAASSERGNEVLAHLAARLNVPLAVNCTNVSGGEPFTLTRQRWGGSLLEEARLTGDIKLSTVAANTIAPEVAPSNACAVQPFTPTLAEKDFRVRVTERVASGAGQVSLAEARLVVGGGRGVGSAEGFKVLEELAELLGGAVGCSRAVTSNGWRPHADQIGQTGNRITAELYIACGVSGATQHIVGCQGAKHILAINTDPDASIFAKADYGIVGDLHTVLPAISAAVRQAQGKA